MCALNDRTIMCRSGSAADTEALAGYVRNIVSQHEMELDEIRRESDRGKEESRRLKDELKRLRYKKYSYKFF